MMVNANAAKKAKTIGISGSRGGTTRSARVQLGKYATAAGQVQREMPWNQGRVAIAA